MKKYWFKRRRFGYGWFPVTYQGWLVVGVYLFFLMAVSYLLLKDVPDNTFSAEVGYFFGYMLISTIVVIRISYVKGPKPKWRWGQKSSDNPDEDV